MKSRLLLILGAVIAAPFTHAVVLDIDGSQAEFFDYLISDNTSDIPDSSQTDGTVTLTLRDESVLKWNNAGYPFGAQSEIDFQPGYYVGSDALWWVSSSLSDALTAGADDPSSTQEGSYYTVRVDSVEPVDIYNITLRFNRHGSGSPRRYYILDDANSDGFDTGDVIADTADTETTVDGLIERFSDFSTKTLSGNPGTRNVTSYSYRFYLSNTPNAAGNTHWTYASVAYAPHVPGLLVYEPFSGYITNDPIETQNGGGFGWTTDWFPANPNPTDDDYWYAGSGSLTNGAYAGTSLPSGAGHAYFSVGAAVDNAHNVIRRTMSTSFNGNTGGTFYFSFLVDGTSFDNGNIFRYSIEMDSATGRRIYLESLADGNLQYRIAGSPGGGSGNPQITGTTTTSPFSGPGTYFIVGKVELTSGAGNDGPNTVGGDGLDNFYAQVYGTSDTVGLEPGSWTLQALGSSLDDVNEFNQISLISSNVDQYAFDEVRVGLTWQDVTGIAPSAPVIVPVGVDIAIAGPDIQVSFESLSSQSYTLEYSTDEMVTWNAVPDQSPVAPVTGNDGTLTITDPGGTPATGGKIFYRVSTTAP